VCEIGAVQNILKAIFLLQPIYIYPYIYIYIPTTSIFPSLFSLFISPYIPHFFCLFSLMLVLLTGIKTKSKPHSEKLVAILLAFSVFLSPYIFFSFLYYFFFQFSTSKQKTFYIYILGNFPFFPFLLKPLCF